MNTLLFSTQTLLLSIYTVPLIIAALCRNRNQNENLCITILLLVLYTSAYNKKWLRSRPDRHSAALKDDLKLSWRTGIHRALPLLAEPSLLSSCGVKLETIPPALLTSKLPLSRTTSTSLFPLLSTGNASQAFTWR